MKPWRKELRNILEWVNYQIVSPFVGIDIMVTKPQEYFMILYFTCSKEFNTLMRQRLDRGLSMNRIFWKDIETKEPVDHVFQTERDIFDYLEYTYVELERCALETIGPLETIS